MAEETCLASHYYIFCSISSKMIILHFLLLHMAMMMLCT